MLHHDVFRKDARGIYLPEIADGADWVMRHEGSAYRLWDSIAIRVCTGVLFCAEQIPQRAFDEALASYQLPTGHLALRDGWYELIGPCIGINADGLSQHRVIDRRCAPITVWPDFFDIRLHCCSYQREAGILWVHNTDGRTACVTRAGFGYAWPPEQKG